MPRIKGGREKVMTNLEIRRKVYDATDGTGPGGFKAHRPGSNNRKKQA